MAANDNLEDKLNRNSGITAIGDLHHNSKPVEEAFRYSQIRGNKVLFNGDWVGDYNFLQVANDLGYKASIQIVEEFMQNELSKQDYQTFRVLQEINSVGSYENYLGLIQQQSNLDANSLEQLNKQLMDVIQYGQSEFFQKRMNQIETKFRNEKQEELIENQLKINAFYEVLLQEQGKDLADILNKYGDVEMLFNEGNHDSRGFIGNYVLPHLQNKEQVTVLNDQVGYVEANGLNIIGMTNSHQRIISSVSQTLSPDAIENYFPHIVEGIEESVRLSGKKSREEILSLESIIKNDREFNRATNNGKDLENKSLHVVATHAPLGSNQYYSAAAAYLAMNADLGVESDTHRNNEGTTSFGSKMVNTGTRMTDIYLNDNGEVQYKTLDFSEDYDSYEGFRNPDLNYLRQRTEEIYKLMREQYDLMVASQNIANDNSSSSSSDAKAA